MTGLIAIDLRPNTSALYCHGATKEVSVIKFRCPSCGQKIAVNDEGADRDITCPVCTLRIVVPPRSAPEFLQRARAETQPMPKSVTGLLSRLTSVPPPQQTPEPVVRPAPPAPLVTELESPPLHVLRSNHERQHLLPNLAQMLMNRLVQAVLGQRSLLLGTSQQATAQLIELEQRLARIQHQHREQISAYEQQLRTLEREVRRLRSENNALVRGRIRDASTAIERGRADTSSMEESADADLLLRA